MKDSARNPTNQLFFARLIQRSVLEMVISKWLINVIILIVMMKTTVYGKYIQGRRFCPS